LRVSSEASRYFTKRYENIIGAYYPELDVVVEEKLVDDGAIQLFGFYRNGIEMLKLPRNASPDWILEQMQMMDTRRVAGSVREWMDKHIEAKEREKADAELATREKLHDAVSNDKFIRTGLRPMVRVKEKEKSDG
jgi:hypothetical protein